MRWQRKADDVALEIDERGKWRYNKVLVSVPRQAGKTNDASYVGLHRTLTQPGARVWYTAQTGLAAKERWIKEVATPADRVLRDLVHTKYGAGDTRLTVRATDAQFRPMPPTAEYLHGEQSDLVFIDEAWAHSETTGRALLQAIKPTMTRRHVLGRGTQMFYLSTRGTAQSTWWHDILDEAIDNPQSRTCVIDYGLDPDDDPMDLELLMSKHPAAHEGLTMEGLIEDIDDMTPAEVARAYGNRATTSMVAVIEDADLQAIQTMEPLDPGPVHIGVAVGWEQSCGAITAVGTIDGVPAMEVIVHRPGTSWMESAIDTIIQGGQWTTITIDNKGPSGALAEQLVNKHGDKITIADADDLVIATEHLLSAARSHTLRLRTDPDLRAEIGGLQLRNLGDRGRMISRKTSFGSIARIEAGVLALRRSIGVTPTPVAPPMIWSPA